MTSKEIVEILEAAGKAGVSELKMKGLNVVFASRVVEPLKATPAVLDEEFNTLSSSPPLQDPNDELANQLVLITDPMEWERQETMNVGSESTATA